MTSTAAARQLREITPPSFSLLRIGGDLRELYQFRELFLALSMHRLRVRYKHSVLGFAWAFLQPLSLVLIYTLAFSRIGSMPSDGVPYPLFVFAGIIPWLLFASSLTTAANGLTAFPQLVTKIYFPREILTLSYVVAAIMDLLFGLVVLLVLMMFYGVPISGNVGFAIPALLVGAVFAAAMALLFSAMNVYMRDVGFVTPLLVHLWLFATPVVYPLSQVPDRFAGLFWANPMTGVVENFRRAVLTDTPPDWTLLGFAAIVSVISLVFSYVFFKAASSNMADVI